jgi:hypothetical protein
MRIYGKTLPEILTEMPWQFKVIVMAGTIWIPFALIHAVYIFSTYGKMASKPGIVNIASSPVNASVADPSLAESQDKGTIFMAYTIVTHLNDLINPNEGRWSPGIRIAVTHPPCKSWSDIGEVAGSNQEPIPGPDSITPLEDGKPGTWWLEHPALVHDPDDPGREFKLYYYKYLWFGTEKKPLTRLYSIIAYKYTTDPNTRKWSAEDWIFSSRAKTADELGNPPDPYNSAIHYHLDQLDPSLKELYFYARPSVTYLNRMLYMTLSGFTQTGDEPDRVIMLASRDHGTTWKYIGTPLRRDDVGKMGPYTKFGGGSLIRKKDQLYFAAVLGDAKVIGLGTFVIPFEDPAKALLEKDKKTGAPLIINHIPRSSVAPSQLGGGYAAYNDLCRGTFVSEFSGLKSNYHIFSTLKDPVEH